MKIPSKSYAGDGEKAYQDSLPLFRLVYKNNKILTITDEVIAQEKDVRQAVIDILEFHLAKFRSME